MMRCTALGVGDAFSARWYSTCLLFEYRGFRLLVDCPHPIRKIIAESSPELDLRDIDAVLLTHLHGDHCSGLEGLGFYARFVLGRRVPLYAWTPVAERIWERLAPGMDRLRDSVDGPATPRTLDDYFKLHPMTLEQPTNIGPFSVALRPTLHHIPTTALRISVGGRTLGYSADTAFDPSLIAWLEDSDRIVHETNLGTHTPLDALLGLPAPVRERLLLVHYPDEFDVDGSPLRCFRQGETVTV